MHMRKTLSASSLRVLFLCALLPGFATMAAAQRIPDLHAVAFSGDRVDLPQAIQGHTAILIVSFSQDSRDNVTAWFHRLAADYRNSPTILYYELPVVAGVPRFLRSYVTNKIKDSVSIPARPRFIPVDDHEDEWKSVTGYTRQNGDDAFLLIVDGSGNIRTHMVAGPPTDQTYAELRQRLDQLKP
jgi:hypothetical protein